MEGVWVLCWRNGFGWWGEGSGPDARGVGSEGTRYEMEVLVEVGWGCDQMGWKGWGSLGPFPPHHGGMQTWHQRESAKRLDMAGDVEECGG
eukprot:759426-Hanusia_phi.AAC.1